MALLRGGVVGRVFLYAKIGYGAALFVPINYRTDSGIIHNWCLRSSARTETITLKKKRLSSDKRQGYFFYSHLYRIIYRL
jgi:hypothetical protein